MQPLGGIHSIPPQSLADAGTTWRGVSCCRHQFVSLALQRLPDPLASVKLFVEARNYIINNHLKNKVLPTLHAHVWTNDFLISGWKNPTRSHLVRPIFCQRIVARLCIKFRRGLALWSAWPFGHLAEIWPLGPMFLAVSRNTM